jgi:hypothetical protein
MTFGLWVYPGRTNRLPDSATAPKAAIRSRLEESLEA